MRLTAEYVLPIMLAMLLCIFPTDTFAQASSDSTSMSLRFIVEHTFDQFALDRWQAWSPTRDILVVEGPEGLYAINFTVEHPQPELILELVAGSDGQLERVGTVRGLDWSPDGLAIAVSLGSPGLPNRVGTLVVVCLPDRRVHHLLKAAQFYEFAWSPSGDIVVWRGPEKTVQRLMPPTGVGRSPDEQSPRRLNLRTLFRGSSRHALVTLTSVGMIERPLPRTATLPLMIRDFFPDGVHALAESSIHGWRTVVIDSAGNETRELVWDRPGCSGTSVTADGMYVIGFQEIDGPDTIEDARLVAFDMARNGPVSITGVVSGMYPHASRRSSRIAYQALHGGVQVGTLTIAGK